MDKYFKSFISNLEDDGTLNVKLHQGEITALLECLNFAHTAAKYLIDIELRKGTQESTKKMMNMSRNSKQLSDLFAKHLDIGEPLSKNFN